MDTVETNPRAFVSYSWDTTAHQRWVHKLAERLQTNGVDVTMDVWDARLGSDLSLFMENAADTSYRVIAIVSETYRDKADNAEGGVGYEKRVITPSIMKDLRGHRVIPVLRNNPTRQLPRFMGAAKYVDLNEDAHYEDGYLELLQDLHGVTPSPKPPLGKNPFATVPDNEVPLALRHDPARYVSPALEGTVTFDYSNNNGRHVIGSGDRAFTVSFSESGHGSIYLMNDPSDIKTIALARGVSRPQEVGDASSYDGSSRHRTLRVGDAGILRNQGNYWAAIFIDEVLTRESNPARVPCITFRYHIPAVPDPSFKTG